MSQPVSETPERLYRFFRKVIREREILVQDSFFEESPEMLCIMGFDGFFEKVNSSFRQFLGYAEEELLEQPISNFVLEEEGGTSEAKLVILKNDVQIVQYENWYQCGDGTSRLLSWHSMVLPGGGLILAVVYDITAQKAGRQTL